MPCETSGEKPGRPHIEIAIFAIPSEPRQLASEGVTIHDFDSSPGEVVGDLVRYGGLASAGLACEPDDEAQGSSMLQYDS
jgi:hypothetical protein